MIEFDLKHVKRDDKKKLMLIDLRLLSRVIVSLIACDSFCIGIVVNCNTHLNVVEFANVKDTVLRHPQIKTCAYIFYNKSSIEY